MTVLACRAADERYATARVMGSDYGGPELRVHAEVCPREDWTHALPTWAWPLVESTRRQRAAFEAWRHEVRQSHPESGAHDLGCGCDSCYGFVEPSVLVHDCPNCGGHEVTA